MLFCYVNHHVNQLLSLYYFVCYSFLSLIEQESMNFTQQWLIPCKIHYCNSMGIFANLSGPLRPINQKIRYIRKPVPKIQFIVSTGPWMRNRELNEKTRVRSQSSLASAYDFCIFHCSMALANSIQWVAHLLSSLFFLEVLSFFILLRATIE